MVELYYKGREGSTMRSYKSAYKRLVELCREAGVSIFRMEESQRCAIWVEAGLAGISAAGVRSISAVISMVRELMGQEDVISGRERNIKKSVVKEMNLRKVKKEKRRPGTIRDVKAIVREARRTNARADWRLAAMVVMCFFGCRRHDDLIRIRVEDVTMYSDRIRVFMRKNKTDVLNEGSVCSITLGGKAFNVKGFLDDYVRRMGLEMSSCVFPKNLGKGGKGVPTTYPAMYRELEDMKSRVGLLGNLTWHSWRVGSATRGNQLGVRRTSIKAAGLWKSQAVDGYCREEAAGLILSQALADSYE